MTSLAQTGFFKSRLLSKSAFEQVYLHMWIVHKACPEVFEMFLASVDPSTAAMPVILEALDSPMVAPHLREAILREPGLTGLLGLLLPLPRKLLRSGDTTIRRQYALLGR